MSKSSILILALFALLGPALLGQTGQKARATPASAQKKPPLSLQQIEALLGVQAPDSTVAAEIGNRGLSFRLTRATIGRLKDRGAGPQTVQALSRAIPQTTVVVTTQPSSPLFELRVGSAKYRADSAGSVTIDDLDPGVYDIVFRHQGSDEDQKLKLNVAEGNTAQELRVLPSRQMLAKQEYDEALKLKDNDSVRLTHFDEAVRLDPGFAAAYLARGIAKGWLGRCQDALPDFDRAIQLNSRSAEAYTNRAACSWNLGNTIQAIQDCSESISINPAQESMFSLRGRAYDKLERWAEAESDLRQAARLGSKDYRTFHELGMNLFIQQKWADAATSFDQALILKPDNVESLRYRGFARNAAGRTQEGLADLERVKQLTGGTSEPPTPTPPKKKKK
jgi:tetratricopeptide (TPR) repeat protein